MRPSSPTQMINRSFLKCRPRKTALVLAPVLLFPASSIQELAEHENSSNWANVSIPPTADSR